MMQAGHRIVVIGLSLSSSWGNGHATTYRALLRALAERGHDVLFLECDRPWYAEHRDLADPDFCTLAFYDAVADIDTFQYRIEAADLVIIGSYVQEGVALARRVRPWARRLAFYDIDTPVTLAGLARGEANYIDAATIPLYDLYLSFTGGPSLQLLEHRYHARNATAFFCAVDPALYRPSPSPVSPRWDLGYLGTYSPDRQPVLERLLLQPARDAADLRFVVAGPQYPDDIAWPENVERIEHLAPADHAAFYNSQSWTLNVTRADMVVAGYSPSVRLFEASACGVPIISDRWAGLDSIFSIGTEIIVADEGREILQTLRSPQALRRGIGEAARARVLASHTAAHRARTLEMLIENLAPAATDP